jgi:hypothetical protein
MNDLRIVRKRLEAVCVFMPLLLLVFSIVLAGSGCSEAEDRQEAQKLPAA